mgnify:CR=1 FL=1
MKDRKYIAVWFCPVRDKMRSLSGFVTNIQALRAF